MRKALQIFRIKRDLTQAEFAKELGYSRNQYLRIESGEQKVTLNFLNALCKTYGMTLEEAKELTKCDGEQEKNNREAR